MPGVQLLTALLFMRLVGSANDIEDIAELNFIDKEIRALPGCYITRVISTDYQRVPLRDGRKVWYAKKSAKI